MQAVLKVWRYDPERPREPYFDEHRVELPDFATVLDALLQIREEKDDSLSMRCSCRSAICGSCAMTINNHAQLACKLKLSDAIEGTGEVIVEPLHNMPPIKDLVVDLSLFWHYVEAIRPWLLPDPPPPGHEYLASNESMQNLVQLMNCIMCASCTADCNTTNVDKTWLGPAALARAYRFVGDPRDRERNLRLREYSKRGGIWDCTHCFECVQQCPKGVAPMDQIMRLRRLAVEAGITDNPGARHGKAFESSILRSGHLNEATLPVFSNFRDLRQLVGLVPIGIRMLRSGKMPPPIRKPIPGIKAVRRIFREAGEET